MDRLELLFQRRLDGLVGATEAAALDRLIQNSPALAMPQTARERLDALLRCHAATLPAAEASLEAICARLPHTPPSRYLRLRLIDALGGLTAVALVGLFFAVTGRVEHMLPVLPTAMASIVVGCVLIVLAGPLRRAEAGVLARVMRRRFMVASGDLLVSRVAGLAIILGGIWLLHRL